MVVQNTAPNTSDNRHSSKIISLKQKTLQTKIMM